jgi:hypothetical protein
MTGTRTSLDGVTSVLISIQDNALRARRDYRQLVRDAENAGETEVAEFLRGVIDEAAARAKKCHDFLIHQTGADRPSRHQPPLWPKGSAAVF